MHANTPSRPTLASTLQQAMQCQQQGQLDNAETLYQQVLAQDPQQADPLHLLGLLHAQRRDFACAHKLIWQAITVNPDEAMYHNNLANFCVESGLLNEAEPMYVRAIKLDNGRINALSNLGLLTSRTDREEEAETLLVRAVEQDPGNLDWRIKQRVEARYKISFEYGDGIKLVVSRCTESESGGRMIDAILTNTMLPDISREFLTRMMQGEPIERVTVRADGQSFGYAF